MAVLVKRSSVAGKVPLTTDLNYGEIAVNSNDGRMFMKANNGGGDTIVEITSVTSLLNKAITTSVTLTATEYSNAMLVFSGALTGNTVITVPNTAHSFIAVNKTTGNYSLTLKANGVTPSVAIVQGAAESLLCDTTGVYATASTTGIEFSKIVPVSGNITADITSAGAVLIVTTAGVTVTLPGANSYPAGAGFGILNLSGGNITVAGNGTDTSELGLPLTVRNNDSYYLGSDNVSKWHCHWYSNPLSPTFTSANVSNNLTVGGTFTSTGAANLNGGATVNGTSTLNGAVTLTNAGPSITFNASGPVLSSPATNTLAASNGTSEVFRINSSGHLLVGTTTDDGSTLATSGDIGSQQGKITSTRFASNGGALVLRNAAGSFASATATLTGTQSGTVTFRSYDGANYQDNASIDAWTEVATTNTSSAANLRFYTTPTGAITKSERMRITGRGGVLIGGTTDDGSSALQVNGAATVNTTLQVGGNITSTGGKVTGTNSVGAITATNGSGAGQTSFMLTRAGAPTDQKSWEMMQDASGSYVLRTVNDGYTAAQAAIQITRSTSYTLGYMELMPTGGHVVIGQTTDNGVDELQVTGTVQSSAGFRFPDGTLQTTANGVTAPTSTLYSPANGVSNWAIGAYNVGFVQVFKNNERMVPVTDFQATDGTTLTVTVPSTGRDRYEVLTSVVYSPSVVFAPTSYTTSITAGQNLITTNYNVGCVWLFKNNMKLLPADFTATNGTTITLTNNSDSSTDVYEVVTFQPFAVSGMLPLSGGTMTGNITFSTAAATNNTILNANAGQQRVTTYQTAGVTRFGEGVSADAETGSNAGSNWFVSRYSDAGAWIDNPLFVSRQTGLVTLSQGIVTPDGYTIASTPSGRNRIINGDCRVAQRVTGNYGNGGIGYSGPDRFQSNNTAGGQFSQSQGTITFGGQTKPCVTQTVTTANTAFATTALWLGIQQRLEGFNVYDLLNGYGTVSFLFNTNVTGQYSVQIFENTGGNSYVSSFNAVANTPTRVTIPLLFPSTLGIPNSAALGLLVTIGTINQGTYQTSSLNQWLTGNVITASGNVNWAATIGNFISVTELQLEPGKIATPFERINIGTQLAQCQRYYETFGAFDIQTGGYALATNVLPFSIPFKVTKRATPTLAMGALTASNCSLSGSAGASTVSLTYAVSVTATGAWTFQYTGTTTVTSEL